MPRVTEVIDYLMEPELFNWHVRLGKAATKKIGDEAKRVGSLVDSLVQEDIRQGGYLSPEGDVPVENCLRGWEKFKKDQPGFVESVAQMQVEVKQGSLVGHPDFVCRRADGFMGIVDLKCSSGIRPRYWTQTAKYFNMHPDLNGNIKPFIGVLRLDKGAEDGAYEYQEIRDMDVILYEIEVFEAYYTAFKHNERVREIMRAQLEEII